MSKKKKIGLGIAGAIIGLIIIISIGSNFVRSISDGGAMTLNDLGAGATAESFAPAAAVDASPAAEEAYDNYDYDTGTGSTEESKGSSDAYLEADASDMVVDGSNSVNTNVTFDENRKLIYRSNVTLETLNYDKTYKDLLAIIEKYDGYIQSEDFENDNGSYLSDSDNYSGITIYSVNNLCIRVPRKNYFDFMKDGLALGNVVSRNQTVEDKTAQYGTNQAYIDVLNKQLDYYSSQMEKLDEELTKAIEDNNTEQFEVILRDMEYMSSEKARVEESLILYKRNNDDIDAESSYATINMTLHEVKEYTKPVVQPEEESTFVSRLKDVCDKTWTHFLHSCEVVLFLVIRLLPTLLILAIIFFIGRAIYKKIRALHKKKFFENSETKKGNVNDTATNNEQE